MRVFVSVAVLVCVLAAGCTKLDEGGQGSEQGAAEGGRRQPVMPGLAPLDGLDAGRASDSNAAGPGNAPTAAQPPAQATGERRGIIGKSTNEVVDLDAALAENPNLVVVEQRAQGGDPVSFALDAYVDVRSRASTFGMIRAVQLHQAEHGRLPTYDEFTRMMRENRIQFTMIEPYRKYAYDSKTGAIVVLEDPDEKRRRYEAAGISVD